jgi:hypothetical protein
MAAGMSECIGPVEADHAGTRPIGRKADDRSCIPLCNHHHRQRGDFAGPFRSWDKARMRQWLDECIKATLDAYIVCRPGELF